MEKLPDHMREFDDTDATRKLIYDNALSSVQKRFPVEDDDYLLELKDARYDGPQKFSMEQQKQALLKNRQLRTPIKGTWQLTHKPTNQVLDSREDVVMHVPYYTERGTFIQGGNEYTVVNQARLKPGVYVRKQRTGEVESHVNVAPGHGRGFRMHLEPETGIFRMNIGQSKIPAYSFFKAVGVEDKDLMKSWGPELLEKNIKAAGKDSLDKVYKRLSGYNYDPAFVSEDKVKYLKESLPQYKLDSGVIARTLGLPDVEGITPAVLLRTSQKMLNVSRGEEGADDRDSPEFSSYHGIEDFVKERIDKDAGKLSKSLLYKIRRAKTLKPVQRGALNGYVESLMHGTGLAMPLEETNPLHTLEQLGRVTKLGEGGIGSAEAITDEARDVNPGQFGFIDPITGPEGLNIGIDVRASYKTFKGKDNNLYAEFRDPTSQKSVYMTPADVGPKAVAFPGQMAKPGPSAWAMQRGKVVRVPKKDVELELPSFAHQYSPNTNMNPMPTSVQPGRQFYGAKFWSQYMPHTKGEVPLVDSLSPDGKTSFTEYYGRKVGTLPTKVGGKVVKVTDNAVTVEDDNGEKHTTDLVKDFPFNRLTGISYFPSVKPGDVVNVGDRLAHSNFTDKETGGINMGVNLKTAVIPARGKSYEDAYVISESAARKMSTERLHGFDQTTREGVNMGLSKFISAFPQQFTKAQVEHIGDDGVIKPGTTVHYGDPLILATGPKLLTSEDAQLGKLHKALRHAVTDKSITWDQHADGIVTDVAVTQGGAKVNVKSTPPVGVGDKLSTRFGLKGVIGTVVPDEEMPRDPATDEPYEMLLNPMGVQSRVAPNQIIEMTLAKIAKETGKRVLMPQEAPQEGWAAWAKQQLEDAGIDEDAPLFDPKTGKTIKPVGNGYVYISAFHHLAEKKLSSRGESGSYTIDEQPAKGGKSGSKRFSQMDVNAALAHGATDIIKDVMLVRGSKDDSYWKALKMGRPLPEPKTPFVYEKFLNTLKAGGINVVDKGDILSILPMTDKDVDTLSKGSIASSKMVNADFEPTGGGLFDVGKTGGMSGNRWTHIELQDPMPNPVMEEPIRRILGLRAKDLQGIIAGRQELGGLTGGAAIKAALDSIDVDSEIDKQKDRVKNLRGANRDNAVKVLGYLSSVKKTGVHPSDWVINKVPVLPPVFRPVARMGDIALETDLNPLYRDLIEVNNTIKELRKDLPESELADQRELMYDAVKAAYGLGESITPEGQSKRLKGAIRQVIGRSPKTGLFQSKVISKTVGGVGRSVVTPSPNLDMDSAGLPEDAAWNLYKDFVTRRLVRRGYPTLRALELIEKRTPEAKEMLEAEMAHRPILVDRAPTWHKFNLLALHPHIVEGNTLQVSPLITKGFTMDFDGDQANFHVPVSDKAVANAKEKMMPSKNLFSLTDLKSVRHSPSMEMTMGLYWLTQQAKKGKTPVVFNSPEEAKKAYADGKISVNDPIVIKGQ